ncbi:MAG: hypothetical protein PHC51_05445 [bacterium]|nr:hypothetical protein [bacterium]
MNAQNSNASLLPYPGTLAAKLPKIREALRLILRTTISGNDDEMGLSILQLARSNQELLERLLKEQPANRNSIRNVENILVQLSETARQYLEINSCQHLEFAILVLNENYEDEITPEIRAQMLKQIVVTNNILTMLVELAKLADLITTKYSLNLIVAKELLEKQAVIVNSSSLKALEREISGEYGLLALLRTKRLIQLDQIGNSYDMKTSEEVLRILKIIQDLPLKEMIVNGIDDLLSSRDRLVVEVRRKLCDEELPVLLPQLSLLFSDLKKSINMNDTEAALVSSYGIESCLFVTLDLIDEIRLSGELCNKLFSIYDDFIPIWRSLADARYAAEVELDLMDFGAFLRGQR